VIRISSFSYALSIGARASATYSVLYDFSRSTDGEYPNGGMLDVGNTLYGTTLSGGTGQSCASGCGTVFALTP